ncbi:APC family permease [Flavisphingomonas formosensis]|uniref:APC family permease n=1 Tax=Flavisphingomonas formosensis TaxID=861534 RepID=UPI0012F96224|nr:amino acid permease [Sphingomonas formosensis]
MSEPAPSSPSRQLGFWMCSALVVGNMIASAIFLLPTSLAPFGWNASIAWIITIAGALCLAHVFATLARAYPHACGPYVYAREAFGPLVAYMVAWSYWVSLWVGNGSIAAAAISYLSSLVPAIGHSAPLAAGSTLAIIWGLTLLNCFSTRAAGGFQLVTTVIKMIPLLAVVLLGAYILGRDGTQDVRPFVAADIHPGSITAAMTLTLWGLLGLESATVPGGKVRDPERTIPRATLVGTLFAGLAYLFICSAAVLMQPEAQVSASPAPLADFVARYAGGPAGTIIAITAALSSIGALAGWILLQGEMPRAMAEDGVFPRFLAVQSARGTPVRAHILASVLLTITVLMTYSGSLTTLYKVLVLLSTSTSLVMYLISALAAMRLRRTGRLAIAGRALMPVAALAALYSVWTIWGAGREALVWGAILFVGGLPIYFLVRRRAS